MSDIPPIPPALTIPPHLIEAWLRLPPDAPIQYQLTRQDLDSFYVALDRCILAQSQFQQCMIRYTNGNIESANTKMADAQRLLIESQNALRQLFLNIMAASTYGGPR